MDKTKPTTQQSVNAYENAGISVSSYAFEEYKKLTITY